jgi:hypothetical protein
MLYRRPLSYLMAALGTVVIALFVAGAARADRIALAALSVAGGLVVMAVGVATMRDIQGTGQALAHYGRGVSPRVRLPKRWDDAFWRLFPRLWGGMALLIGAGWFAAGVANLV